MNDCENKQIFTRVIDVNRIRVNPSLENLHEALKTCQLTPAVEMQVSASLRQNKVVWKEKKRRLT